MAAVIGSNEPIRTVPPRNDTSPPYPSRLAIVRSMLRAVTVHGAP